MTQMCVILNVQHQLEDILNNQHLILQNQHDMLEKLSDIESRIVDLENNSKKQDDDDVHQHHQSHQSNFGGVSSHDYTADSNSYDNDMEDNASPQSNGNQDGNESVSLEESNALSTLQTQIIQKGLLNETEIKRIYSIAKSRGNFAALLVQNLYTKQERITSNVMGTRGKRSLSPNRMSIIKRLTLKMYPGANELENELLWKRECIKAIDSKNRKVKLMPAQFKKINNNYLPNILV